MTKVCVIGAGPSGMAVLYHLARPDGGVDVKCFEKQSDWGGLWNYTWHTGTDEYGDLCHGSMYRHLWSNAPKDVLEYQDYTFEEHFGKLLPSYAPRSAVRDYMEGRFTKLGKNQKSLVYFDTVVKHVEYRENTDDFLVTVNDRKADVTFSEVFDYVIVASGIFSVPNKATFPGIDKFRGLVIHSHDFREARAFTNQRILCIGASYSAEDISIQCKKFGAQKVICTWRNQPMNYKFPEGIEERPLVVKFEGKTAYFKDGTEAEVDCVIFCTGYLYSHPYLNDKLRLKEKISLYPNQLYKGIVWTEGANNKLMYIGAQNQFITFPMFESQAIWIAKYINGELNGEPKVKSEMKDDIQVWRDKLMTVASGNGGVDFQANYILDLNSMTGYSLRIDVIRNHLKRWLLNRKENIATYRDQQFTSPVTGKLAPPLKFKWITIQDDSLEYYLNSASSTD